MSDCANFIAFCNAVGNDAASKLIDRICDAQAGDKSDGIRISTAHRHDAINYTLEGEAEYEGKTYAFLIDNGNWNGTVVREWGNPENAPSYEPPPPPRYEAIPQNEGLKQTHPGLWAVYLQWRQQDWFKDLVRGYNYDNHFAPGNKTERYYREMAAKRGLKIVLVDQDWTP